MYICNRCGREWEDSLAHENNYCCTRKCNGILQIRDNSCPDLIGLPSVLYIPLRNHFEEQHQVMRLHRMCDAVEIVVRFLVIILLAEIRKLHNENNLPVSLTTFLKDRIEHPTFGQWKDVLVELLRVIKPESCLLKGVSPFCEKTLLPDFFAPASDEIGNIIVLRNRIVHSGAVSTSYASSMNDRWQERIVGLVEGVSFLSCGSLCHMTKDGIFDLSGDGSGSNVEIEGDKTELSSMQDHVLYSFENFYLDLWPICDFRRTGRNTQLQHPLMYYRAESNRVLYTALTGDYPFHARTDVVAAFRSFFNLEQERKSKKTKHREQYRILSRELIGRSEEIQTIKQYIKEINMGIVWISGHAGIGKSMLLARIAADLSNAPDRIWLFYWRFSADDHDSLSGSAFVESISSSLYVMMDEPPARFTPVNDWNQSIDQIVDNVSMVLKEKGKKGVFVLDALDEAASFNCELAGIPFRNTHDNIVWVCAGRSPDFISIDKIEVHFHDLFPSGLKVMPDADIRALLLEKLGCLKYDIIELDCEEILDGNVLIENRVIDGIVRAASGLPLYVQFVIEDIVSGKLKISEIPEKLPNSLSEYYSQIMKRNSIGDLNFLITPMVAHVTLSPVPIGKNELYSLLQHQGVLTESAESRELFEKGLAAAAPIFKAFLSTAGDEPQFSPYHHTVREYVEADTDKIFSIQKELGKKLWIKLLNNFSSLDQNDPIMEFVIVNAIKLSRTVDDQETAVRLILDLEYLERRIEFQSPGVLAGEIDEIVSIIGVECKEGLALQLIATTLKKHMLFLERHPEAVFQVLRNNCCWYGSELSYQHYTTRYKNDDIGSKRTRLKQDVHELFEEILSKNNDRKPWIRSLRPPEWPVDSYLKKEMQLTNYGAFYVLAAHPDKDIFAVAHECIRIYDIEMQVLLYETPFIKEGIFCMTFSPDGEYLAVGFTNGAVSLYSVPELTLIATCNNHSDAVTSLLYANDYLFSSGKDGLICKMVPESLRKEYILKPDSDNDWKGIYSIVYNPIHSHILFSSYWGVYFWDLDANKCNLIFSHDFDFLFMGISYDGTKIVLSGVEDPDPWTAIVNIEKFYNLEDSAIEEDSILYLDGDFHSFPFAERVDFSNDDRFFFVCGKGGSCLVFDFQKNNTVFLNNSGIIQDVCITREDDFISIDEYGLLRVWDVSCESENLCPPDRLYGYSIYSISFNPAIPVIISGTKNPKEFRFWDSESGLPIKEVRITCYVSLQRESSIRSVHFIDQCTILVNITDGSIVLFDFNYVNESITIELLKHVLPDLNTNEEVMKGFVEARDAVPLFITYDGTVFAWDHEQDKVIWLEKLPLAEIKTAELLYDRRYLKVEDDTGKVVYLRISDREIFNDFPNDIALPEFITNVSWERKETAIIDSRTGVEVAWYPVPLYSITSHPKKNCWAGISESLHILSLEDQTAIK